MHRFVDTTNLMPYTIFHASKELDNKQKALKMKLTTAQKILTEIKTLNFPDACKKCKDKSVRSHVLLGSKRIVYIFKDESSIHWWSSQNLFETNS